MVIKVYLLGEEFLTENDEQTKKLTKNAFGTEIKNQQIQLTIYEALFLLETEQIEILNQKNKKIIQEQLIKRGKKQAKQFLTNYAVYADLRSKNYIVKTALKFGAPFRAYEKGSKLGESHSKWLVYPTREHDTITWHEFSAKNRIAHSTRKNLLIGVVDDEQSISYWEIKWVKS